MTVLRLSSEATREVGSAVEEGRGRRRVTGEEGRRRRAEVVYSQFGWVAARAGEGSGAARGPVSALLTPPPPGRPRSKGGPKTGPFTSTSSVQPLSSQKAFPCSLPGRLPSASRTTTLPSVPLPSPPTSHISTL